MNRMKLIASLFHLIRVSILLVWVLPILGCSGLISERYSDKEMIDFFLKNENSFNELAKMGDAESDVIRVADSFTRTKKSFAWPRPESEWGITKTRWDEYRTLFARLGIKGGMDIADTEKFGRLTFFVMRSCGKFSDCSEREKGYVHSTSDLKPLVESIDSIPKSARREDRIYMSISPNWYIYENRD